MAPGVQTRATWIAVALAFGLGLDAPEAARAQAAKGTITQIVIEGLETISEDRVREKLVSKVGRELDERDLDADLNALAKTNWFAPSSIRNFVKPDRERGGLILTFRVQEMPVVREVEFRGLHKLKRKDLEEATRLKPGARADQITARLGEGAIQRLYQEKGYDYAQVRLLEGGKHGDRRVVYEIFEGPKCTVHSVAFEGNKFASSAMLETKIACKPKFLGAWPAKFNRDEVEADAKKLREYYDGLGFFEVKVNPVVRPGAEPGQMDVTYVIWEGTQYKVRAVLFEGNEQIATSELQKDLKLTKGQAYTESLREVDEKLLRTKYGKIGCIDAHIIKQPPVYLDEPGMVDLVYKIEEGSQYNLGRIILKGNDRTAARVVLREFNQAGLVPGTPLDLERIELAKKRIGNLRYFAMDPSQGKPLEIAPTNRRSAAHPYDAAVTPSSAPDLGGQMRLQSPSPDDAPAPRPPASVARRQDAPPAPGAGPASVGVIEDAPPNFQVPAIEAPAPAPGVATPPPTPDGGPPFVPGGPPGTATPPAGSREPPGTFPSVPGMNMTDVGPGRNEPFPNRDYADLVASLDEVATGRLMLGVGATSYGGIFGNLILHESNFSYRNLPSSLRDLFSGRAFRGDGQDLRIELSPGTQVNRAQISFRNPYLFDMPIGFGASAYTFRRFYPDYTEDRTGGRFSLGSQFGLRTYADVALRIEDVNFHGFSYPAPADFLAAAGHTTLASLRPSLRFDNRNDPFTSTAGQYLEFAFEQGWGTFTFPKVTVEGRQYFTLGSRPDGSGKRFVTLRGFFGATGRDTPVYERFFAGDFRSMRGFSYRGVGPRELGVNVGGVMELLGSVEYQFPWTANDKLQQVVFCDFGTVESGYDITQFRAAVGTGVRIYLPQQMFGPLPLAFDIAFPVIKGPEDRTRIFTFFIGAFW